MLNLTTDKHEASRGLSATAELLVLIVCHTLTIFKMLALEQSAKMFLRLGAGPPTDSIHPPLLRLRACLYCSQMMRISLALQRQLSHHLFILRHGLTYLFRFFSASQLHGSDLELLASSHSRKSRISEAYPTQRSTSPVM